MSRLALIKPADLEKLILGLGFVRKRQKGSHVFYRHPDGRRTSIPFHAGKDIKRGLLRDILNQIKINIDEYNELIK
jgi:predicted RNA binding protein YcfA (HicA-like mRNA interferase family)